MKARRLMTNNNLNNTTRAQNNTEKPTGILIWGEKKLNGELSPVVFELATQANLLAQKLNNCAITVITAGNNTNIDAFKHELSKYGVNELVVIKHEGLNDYDTSCYSSALLQYIKNTPKEIFLIGATRQGRELAPQISSALNTGLTADCTGLEINEDGNLAATRPTFGGELMATIMCKTYPQMATVRPRVFEAVPVEQPTDIRYTEYFPPNLPEQIKKIIKSIPLAKGNDKLGNAKIVVAGGKGLKDKETFDKLYKLAELLGGEVGASRKAVDARLAPHEIQIGQTGRTIAPELYIAFGISGAVQHCVGVSGAKKIIAINSDPTAPICTAADALIVADAANTIDCWIENLSQQKTGE